MHYPLESTKNHRALTFGKTELLQLTGQRLTVYIILCSTGEDEAEHCHSGFDISTFCTKQRSSFFLVFHKNKQVRTGLLVLYVLM